LFEGQPIIMTRKQFISTWVGLGILSFSWFAYLTHLQPVIEIDSSSYTTLDMSSLVSMLSNKRTCGYPVFLKMVNSISTDQTAIVYAHWLAMYLAVSLFAAGLIASGYHLFTALCASAPLLFGRWILEYGSVITADSLACSLAVGAAGCFFGCFASPTRRIAWCGLTLLTFLTYQTRPAYLFLIPLWPLVGFVLEWLVIRREFSLKRAFLRSCLLATTTFIPFLLFCSLRWAVVGDWGLVSFGGYNLIGIVAQFLDEGSISSLPDDLQPLAKGICDCRSSLKTQLSPANYMAMEEMYNPVIWSCADPTAKELYGDNPIIINQAFSRLSSELLRQHPKLYLKWLIWNAAHAFNEIVRLTVTDQGTRLLGLIFLITHAFRLFRGPSTLHQISSTKSDAEAISKFMDARSVRFREVHLLFWTAVAMAAAKALLVILVEPAISRYMIGAMPLVPGVFGVFLAHYLRAGLDHEPS
jgi:hypothetical protein